MNEDSPSQTLDRHAGSRKLFSQIHRYRAQLGRWWWVLLLCVLLAIGVEELILRNSPPEFASIGQMVVNVKLNISQNSLYTEELGNFLGTQQAMMQSSQVTDRARERLNAQFPASPLRPILKVSVLPKTTIFVLQATSSNPDYTKAYLQACMEEFQNLKKDIEQRASDVTIAGLTDQMLRLDPDIRKVDDQLAAFMSTNDVALTQEANGLETFLGLLYQRLAEAQSEYDLLETMSLDQNLLLEQDRNPMAASQMPVMGSAGPDSGLLANAVLGGQSMQFAPSSIGMEYLSIKQQLQLLKVDQDRYGEYLKPEHPKMVELSDQHDRLNQLLAIFKEQSLEQLEAKKSALALQITNLESETKKLGEQNVLVSRKYAEYDRIKAKGDRLQTLYDQLLATLQSLDVNKDIGPETVTIYQPASDAFPVPLMSGQKLLIAGLLGLALGLGILLLVNRMDDRVMTLTELGELFDEEIIGQIPREKSGRKKNGLQLLHPQDTRHAFTESFRNLRSSLLYNSNTGARPHTLLITSSIPNDGKSVTASNLAITLAASGARVLLVDADLRKGSLHNRFNVQGTAGLSECLTQGLDWHPLACETAQPNLFLLPRGAIIHHSSEYFIGPAMEKFLKETNQSYDYVLIDTVPVMAADDVTSLAPRVDGVIFVIRAEHTSARVARASLDMLTQRKARVLGLVLNSVKPSIGDYYGYRDYYAEHPPK